MKIEEQKKTKKKTRETLQSHQVILHIAKNATSFLCLMERLHFQYFVPLSSTSTCVHVYIDNQSRSIIHRIEMEIIKLAANR